MSKHLSSSSEAPNFSTTTTPSRDIMQLFAIYGTDEWPTIIFLLLHSLLFFAAALALLLLFPSPNSSPAARLASFIAGAASSLLAALLLLAAANVLHSSLSLRAAVAAQILAAVPNWSSVHSALDVGCGRGILLNAVAAHLRSNSPPTARVVGLDRRRDVAVAALRRAAAEGVANYVTCRDGDERKMPFGDESFDVVVSAASGLGGADGRTAVAEIVRVLRPGGYGVIWDPACGAQHEQRLAELRMDDIWHSERIGAYLGMSRIVSFRKPIRLQLEEDGRDNIC